MMYASAHKQHIRHCFNQSARSYDENSQIQQRVGQQLIQLLIPYRHAAEHVIDLGCGSGWTTEQLASKISYDQFDAIDIADHLLTKAQGRLNNDDVNFHEADFDVFPLLNNKYFDLIFSNMALHWSLELENTMYNLTQQLSINGLIAFTLPIEGTFAELPAMNRNQFYSLAVLSAWLKAFGLRLLSVSENKFLLHFDSMLAAMKSIKASGANHVLRNKPESLPKCILTSLRPTTLTYSIGYFVAEKSLRPWTLPCGRGSV